MRRAAILLSILALASPCTSHSHGAFFELLFQLPLKDEQFGTFTGASSFDGTLEILNDRGAVLLRTTDKFKGWER